MTEYGYDFTNAVHRGSGDSQKDKKGKTAGLLALLFVPVIALGALLAGNSLSNKGAASYNGDVTPFTQTSITPTPGEGLQRGIGGGDLEVIDPMEKGKGGMIDY